MKKYPFLFIVVLNPFSANCQTKKDNRDIDYKMILFKVNSYELSEEEKNSLDSLNSYMKQRILANCYIFLTIWSCPEEIKENKFIGVMRSQMIINYCSEKYNIPKNFFLIRDKQIGSQEWASPCIYGGYGFIYISGGYCQ